MFLIFNNLLNYILWYFLRKVFYITQFYLVLDCPLEVMIWFIYFITFIVFTAIDSVCFSKLTIWHIWLLQKMSSVNSAVLAEWPCSKEIFYFCRSEYLCFFFSRFFICYLAGAWGHILEKRAASPKRKKGTFFFIFKEKGEDLFHFQGVHFFMLLLCWCMKCLK